jgi:uncharacterized repeat protein (TIGR01451 family)
MTPAICRVFPLPGIWLAIASGIAIAQPDVHIVHEPLSCFRAEGNSLIQARVENEVAGLSVRVHVQRGPKLEYHWMVMSPSQFKIYEAVLPPPDPGSKELTYFLDAAVGDRVVAETPKYAATVDGSEGKCGTLTTRAAGELQPPPPHGKKALFAILGLGAAGAAAVGIGVLDSSTTSDLPPQQPPTGGPEVPPTTTVPPSVPVTACFEFPNSAEVNEPIRMDASCSSPRGSIDYEWDFGDGRSRTGRVVNVTYPTAGDYLVELRVFRLAASPSAGNVDRISKAIRIFPVPQTGSGPQGPVDNGPPDLEIQKVGTLETTILNGVLVFHIDYTLEVRNLGTGPANDVVVDDVLAADLTLTAASASRGSCTTTPTSASCSIGVLGAGQRAIVSIETDVRRGVLEDTVISNTGKVTMTEPDPTPANNADVETTVLTRPPGISTGTELQSRFVSNLETEGRRATGIIQYGGSPGVTVTDSQRFPHRVVSSSTTVVVEATLTSIEAGGDLRWRFEFEGGGGIAPGSIEPLEGDVLARGPLGIAFRLAGRPGEKVRFTYRLQN